MLIHDYELFEMNPKESIKDIFTRFTNITNGLISLEKIFTNEELVRKILRCLPREYDAKATVIVEARDLSTFELDMLLGSLTTYELEMKRKKKKKEDDDSFKKKKVIALRAASPTTFDNDATSSGDEEGKIDDEIALVSRRFNALMKKKRNFSRRAQKKSFKPKEKKESTSKNKEDDIVCYECKKSGHIKPNCPLLKTRKVKKKKQALVATWSDSDSSTSEEDEKNEVVNLCLMANIDDEDDEEESSEKVKDSLSYDELEENLFDLIHEYEKLKNKYFSLKKLHLTCESFCNALKNKINDLILHDENLFKLNEELSMHISRLTKENEILKVRSSMHNINIKNKITSTRSTKIKLNTRSSCNNLSHAHMYTMSHITCNFYNKHDHILHTCMIRRSILSSRITSYVWISKGITHVNNTIATNPIGPKFIWVPKVKT
ncbi:hypothetical protein AXF42_Ash001901 [Apostasia shenzhenica]|uniref:CCHC-type domain-containing protein n=1 Tax=Apostasia shenzhenica TaxID=1088818 RepID=A0A2I0ABJ4_9ASPA|nr:hypothetical protein AXF42_Ash001901 [Apostasia shenzhenica]